MARRSDDPLDSVLRRTGRHSAGLSIDDTTWVLVEHMAPSMHSRSPIQVGPKTPGNDTLAQTACEIGMLLDCERTRRSPV